MTDGEPMTPHRWREVKDVLGEALDLSPRDRAALLARVHASDPDLYREVVKLLRAENLVDEFLETPAYGQLTEVKPLFSTAPTRVYEFPLPGIEPGDLFLDRYEMLDVVGQGGMGTVFRARHQSLGTIVAVKVLHAHLLTRPDVIERFKREARMAARIDHPNMVKVFDYGVENGTCFLVMEHLRGESLRARLSRSARMSLADLDGFLAQLCGALDYIHAHGIIHRDLKPDNLFFHQAEDGEVLKVLDLGIAKPTDLTGAGESLTQTGAVFGTPHYMSPEQCLGKPIDRRADLYALGIILYEVLAGRRPFDVRVSLSVMYAQVNTAPDPLHEVAPDIRPAVARTVMRLMEKNPDRRFASAAEFLAAFTAARTTEDGATADEPREDPAIAPPPGFLREKRVWAGFAAALVLAVTGLVFAWRGRPPAPVTFPPPPVPVASAFDREFIAIPGGPVTIGRDRPECPDPECTVEPDEMPAHRVELAPFFLARTEVTNREYFDFVAATGRPAPPGWKNGRHPSGAEDLPVVGVSWEDATAYCRWRSTRDGRAYRLPTEAEWERAARGDDGRRYPWGDRWEAGFAHAAKDPTRVSWPVPVTQPPNTTTDRGPFGVSALAGNVREWTDSQFAPYPGSPYRPRGRDADCRVIRGGGFSTKPSDCRTSFRAWQLPTYRDADLGFRLAVSQ